MVLLFSPSNFSQAIRDARAKLTAEKRQPVTATNLGLSWYLYRLYNNQVYFVDGRCQPVKTVYFNPNKKVEYS